MRAYCEIPGYLGVRIRKKVGRGNYGLKGVDGLGKRVVVGWWGAIVNPVDFYNLFKIGIWLVKLLSFFFNKPDDTKCVQSNYFQIIKVFLLKYFLQSNKGTQYLYQTSLKKVNPTHERNEQSSKHDGWHRNEFIRWWLSAIGVVRESLIKKPNAWNIFVFIYTAIMYVYSVIDLYNIYYRAFSRSLFWVLDRTVT